MATSMPSRGRKPGRVPKGGERFPVRVPAAHRRVYENEARAKGYTSLSDYVAATMALVHDLDVPEYTARSREPDHQDALPVGTREALPVAS